MKMDLVLEDGTKFSGKSFGAQRPGRVGDIVFFTGMTGYQEVLTDPSYCDELVCMTYPSIGNYGVNREDFESFRPFLSGMIVREYCEAPNNWRSYMSLDQALKEYSVPGMSGVDTRALTRKIRSSGSMKAAFVYEGQSFSKLEDLFVQEESLHPVARVSTQQWVHHPGTGKRVLVMDFGCKKGIIRELVKRSCDVLLVPWNTKIEEIHRWKPDGILLSNGPGDPRELESVIDIVRDLRKQYPIFGICLGHQLLALSYGLSVERLKFGHHGANHPVYDVQNEKTYISSQNHNYAVTEKSLKESSLTMTHFNLNDKSVEGFRDEFAPVFSVQYHPEASPGPKDSNYLFDQFLSVLNTTKEGVLRG